MLLVRGSDRRRLIHEGVEALSALKRAVGREQVLDEGIVGDIVVSGDTAQPTAVAVTSSGLFWRLLRHGVPVLSLRFDDVVGVMVDDGSGVRIVSRPKDFPDFLRRDNPTGELDANFIFGSSEAGQQLRQCTLDLAHSALMAQLAIKSSEAGETLAPGEGCLEGIFESERWYANRVEARGSAILVHCSG